MNPISPETACHGTRDSDSTETICVLGIGNVLWADEGFGVRCVEALQRRYECEPHVVLIDGGTQGLYLIQHVQQATRLLIFDAIDYGLRPGTLQQVENDDVPRFMGAKKLSLHQTGFQEVLMLVTTKRALTVYVTGADAPSDHRLPRAAGGDGVIGTTPGGSAEGVDSANGAIAASTPALLKHPMVKHVPSKQTCPEHAGTRAAPAGVSAPQSTEPTVPTANWSMRTLLKYVRHASRTSRTTAIVPRRLATLRT